MNKNILKEIFAEMAAIFKTKLEAAEEPKSEEPKAEEPKAEESAEEPKAEEQKSEEPKAEESSEEPKSEEPKAEEPKVEPWKEQLDALKADNESLKNQIAELKTANEQFASKKEMEEASAEFATQVKSLNDTLKLLAGMPAEFSKTNEDFKVQDSKHEKLMAFVKTFH